jgi:hypothetical protein
MGKASGKLYLDVKASGMRFPTKSCVNASFMPFRAFRCVGNASIDAFPRLVECIVSLLATLSSGRTPNFSATFHETQY